MAHLQINCDFGIFVTSSTGHVGSTKNCAPCSDHHVWTRAFIKHQLRSLSRSRRNHLWSSGAQRQHCPQATVLVFLDSELVSAATTSSSIALTIALVELCVIESTTTLENFVEFRWRNLWQSRIYRSPVKSGREFG